MITRYPPLPGLTPSDTAEIRRHIAYHELHRDIAVARGDTRAAQERQRTIDALREQLTGGNNER